MVTELDNLANTQKNFSQANFFTKISVLLFILAYITIVFIVLFDGWIHDYAILKNLFNLSKETSLSPMLVSIIHTVLGSLLGCGVLAIVSFHKYIAYERTFEVSHVWGYFCGPWLAATLGLVVFALLQSGLLVFAGNVSGEPQTESTNLGYLAIGFLSGFGWYRVTKILELLVTRVFSAPESKGE